VAAYAVDALARLDVRLYEAAHLHWGVPYRAATAVVTTFDPASYAVLVAVLAGATLLAGRRDAAIAAGVLVVAAPATSQLLKPLLAQPHPHGAVTGLPAAAWPSGHTTAAAAFAIAVVLATPPGARRRPAAALAALGTLVVGVALVALGRHYPSDVLGGLCVAGAWGAATWHVLSRRARRATA
jgi:membrane-associated phospholipid phosphatase